MKKNIEIEIITSEEDLPTRGGKYYTNCGFIYFDRGSKKWWGSESMRVGYGEGTIKWWTKNLDI